MGPPFFCPPQRMPPLCKGRWHGAAVTEGLLALDFRPRQNRCRRDGHCPPAFLRPHSSLSLFGERKEPPQRQKMPAPFRFRRGGESSIFAASFFLPESRPLRWVAFRLILERKRTSKNGSAPVSPNCDPAKRSQFGKEEGGRGYGAFAASAEAECSWLLLTPRRTLS